MPVKAKFQENGRFGLQIHSGPPAEAWYKDIQIKSSNLSLITPTHMIQLFAFYCLPDWLDISLGGQPEKTTKTHPTGYFLAGRSLSWSCCRWFIALN